MAFSKVGEEGNKSIAAAMPQAPGLGEALGDQCSHLLSQMVRKNTWWCGVRAAFLWPLCFCSSWVCTWEQSTRQNKSIWSWKNTLTLHHGYSKSVPHLHQFHKIQRHKKKPKKQKKPELSHFVATKTFLHFFSSYHCSCATACHHHCYLQAPRALGKERISWQLWTSWQKWNRDGSPVPGAPWHPYLGISCYESHTERGAGRLLLQRVQPRIARHTETSF